ncbi:MAG: hypothetical protein IJ312_04125 [Treponema sp.]|nr:hypothetical protein [Treponema sp.]
MNLSLKVHKKENANFSSLLKQMCELNCRIDVDFNQGKITVINIETTSVENIIDAINECFEFESINIVPSSTTAPTLEIPAEATSYDVSQDSPQERETNSVVEEQLNNFSNQIHQLMYTEKVNARIVSQYIASTISEIQMRYVYREKVPFKVGDIVSCNYGCHWLQEISGNKVHALVCNINDQGMAFVIPITKKNKEKTDKKYLPFTKDQDVSYYSSQYNGGTLLLQMGRYLMPERFGDVVGVAKPDFFKEVLSILPAVTTFTHCDTCNVNEPAEQAVLEVQSEETVATAQTSEQFIVDVQVAEQTVDIPVTEQTSVESQAEEVIEAETVVNETSAKSDSMAKPKKVTVEKYLATLLADHLDALDKNNSVLENAEKFMDSVGLPRDEKVMLYALVSACQVKRIATDSIYLSVKDYIPNLSEKMIATSLATTFKKWLDNYPSVCETFSKVSPIPLLKVFAAKMNKII